jgi:hypothetical protein
MQKVIVLCRIVRDFILSEFCGGRECGSEQKWKDASRRVACDIDVMLDALNNFTVLAWLQDLFLNQR